MVLAMVPVVSSWEQETKCYVRCIVSVVLMTDRSVMKAYGGLIGWWLVHVTIQGTLGLHLYFNN
jgi:hypothetical protein